jgi:hypothetical protein
VRISPFFIIRRKLRMHIMSQLSPFGGVSFPGVTFCQKKWFLGLLALNVPHPA